MTTSAANAIRLAFEKHGFQLTSMGGGCSAFIRNDGAIEEVVTRADDLSVPEAMDEAVMIGTAEKDNTDDEPLTGYTVADVLAALRNPSDEYHLLSLRLQNNVHKSNA